MHGFYCIRWNYSHFLSLETDHFSRFFLLRRAVSTICGVTTPPIRPVRSCSACPSPTIPIWSASKRNSTCYRNCTDSMMPSWSVSTDTSTFCGRMWISRKSTMNSWTSKTGERVRIIYSYHLGHHHHLGYIIHCRMKPSSRHFQ